MPGDSQEAVVFDLLKSNGKKATQRKRPFIPLEPFSLSGPHRVNNEVLLRSDIHKLFDKGYATITPKLIIEVSRRISEEFENGRNYYNFHEKQIHALINPEHEPSRESLIWHNEKVFRG